jgi:hypothetical protein
MLTIQKSYEFLFLYCLVGYELAAIFMNGNILFGVVVLIGELCVVWSSWADLICWVSINCKQWLMFKRATKFLQKTTKLSFLLLWLLLVLELGFLSFS